MSLYMEIFKLKIEMLTPFVRVQGHACDTLHDNIV